MRRPLHKLVTAFLAVWIPFCCCQVRAAVDMATHAQSVAPSSSDAEPRSCCSHCAKSKASSCCSPSAEERSQPGKTPASQGSGCCTACKDRVLPAGISLQAPDTFGVDMLALATAPLLLQPVRTTLSVDVLSTGPPLRCTGRQILQQSSILQV